MQQQRVWGERHGIELQGTAGKKAESEASRKKWTCTFRSGGALFQNTQVNSHLVALILHIQGASTGHDVLVQMILSFVSQRANPSRSRESFFR